MRGPTIVTMELPYDQDALWFDDLNVVALAPHLDAAGRGRALDELQAEWRRCIESAPGALLPQKSPVASDS